MQVIGIDPGKSGGIACLCGYEVLYSKMPETDADVWQTLMMMRDQSSEPTTVFLEKVHSMPGQGVVSVFSFGQNFGSLKMACIGLGMRLEMVSPQKWQKALGCLTKGDKNISKARAQELFPGVKCTHAISDALLIAEFGRRQQ